MIEQEGGADQPEELPVEEEEEPQHVNIEQLEPPMENISSEPLKNGEQSKT